MELQFQKSTRSCLDTAVQEVQNIEQTQELKLSEEMPDVGRILGAWGQVLLRGKEWREDSVFLSGGMLVWVLYAPEDGTKIRCLDGWIPFQISWDLPDRTPEGQLRFECLTRFVDARAVSARKILVRAGIAALAEAYVPMEQTVYLPESVPEGVELLRSSYPLWTAREAGEKTFLIDEELTLPASAPQPERLIYYRMTPAVTEQRVMANKVVFRGNGNLHILYESEEGQLHGWDFPLAFSQFAPLQESYSQEAQAQLMLCVTNLELDMNEEGQMRLKCGIVGQYLITDREMLELVTDAYSPNQALELQHREVRLPVVLETRQDHLQASQTIPAAANLAADIQFLPDYPRQQQMEDRMNLRFPGIFQVLYYAEDGSLQSATARWEGELMLPWSGDSRICVLPMADQEPRVDLGADMTVKCGLTASIHTTTDQTWDTVAALELGDLQNPDPDRPSLILRRVGSSSLWEIAKGTGSTMDAIRKANGLQEEPEPGQILLIPVS